MVLIVVCVGFWFDGSDLLDDWLLGIWYLVLFRCFVLGCLFAYAGVYEWLVLLG